jgi:hypothetical protein
MSMTLRHQFDVLNDVTHTLELGSAGTHRLGTLSTLDELADMLWRIT